ncbi:hypothetical protein ABBQ38_014201 [Trebouxia sp. C0009 RCD-2024]
MVEGRWPCAPQRTPGTLSSAVGLPRRPLALAILALTRPYTTCKGHSGGKVSIRRLHRAMQWFVPGFSGDGLAFATQLVSTSSHSVLSGHTKDYVFALYDNLVATKLQPNLQQRYLNAPDFGVRIPSYVTGALEHHPVH